MKKDMYCLLLLLTQNWFLLRLNQFSRRKGLQGKNPFFKPAWTSIKSDE